ncbi:MAG TPA: S-adenosyl-l-methionine hydroxide adenosyltransferase family protein [Opitutaceae bacterium]|nr:S-adenosyl-l-methionine hydroxide adenosyltransferase family protein [Opitutaceae bacterium]
MKKLLNGMICLAVLLAGRGLAAAGAAPGAGPALVIQTDFGLKDGAVAAMRGVAFGVSPNLPIFDLSHENTPYDIWEAAYRLKQTAPFWPAGTVFVSVIDPGVGTARKSVVLKTKSGHFFVSPDNGTLTLVAEELGVDAVREIDETRNRRPGSEKSYTFHGRDVYVYVGARLAAGVIRFDEVGPELPARVVMLPYERPRLEGKALIGTIPYLDFQFGNIWTNLDDTLFARLQPKVGDRFRVTIAHAGQTVYAGEMPYARTFGDVPEGAPLLYLNSLMNVAFALNQGDFVKRHAIGYGAEWSVRVEKLP